MKLFLATNNQHKKREMIELCKPYEVIIPSDKGILFNPIENGNSFIENSIIKAKTLWNIVHEPVIADDSGICVSALDDRPGIYSARYSGLANNIDGHELTQSEQNRLLIEEVNFTLQKQNKSIEDFSNRNCRYVCSIVLYYGVDKFITAQETFEGVLLTDIDKSTGTKGFGYDPIVYLPKFSKTIAELTDEEKNSMSHRGKAVKAVMQAFSKISL